MLKARPNKYSMRQLKMSDTVALLDEFIRKLKAWQKSELEAFKILDREQSCAPRKLRLVVSESDETFELCSPVAQMAEVDRQRDGAVDFLCQLLPQLLCRKFRQIRATILKIGYKLEFEGGVNADEIAELELHRKIL